MGCVKEEDRESWGVTEKTFKEQKSAQKAVFRYNGNKDGLQKREISREVQ